jgi:hypothetical protein
MKYEMQAEGDIKTSGLAAVDPKLVFIFHSFICSRV